MRDPHPWICDICRVHKQESNHWLLGGEFESQMTTHPPREAGFFIEPWSERYAEDDFTTAKKLSHLCGVECVQKWATQRLGKIYNQCDVQEKKNATPSTD